MNVDWDKVREERVRAIAEKEVRRSLNLLGRAAYGTDLGALTRLVESVFPTEHAAGPHGSQHDDGAPRKVNSPCPACGMLTLEVHAAGNIRCRNPECDMPTAVDDLLDQEPRHVAVLYRTGHFTLTHPLLENLDDDSMKCPIHDDVRRRAPHYDPGTYVVTWSKDYNRASFLRIPDHG